MEAGIWKRLSTIALATALAVTFIPVMGTMTNGTVGEVEAKAATSGTCGENMTWELDGEGTLTISGSGRMFDFADEEAPWYDIRSEIKSVQIGNNVTRLGMYAFWECSNLSEVKLPDSLKEIGRGAFEDCDSLKGITFPANLASIFADAFYDCDGLEKIHIPASVTLVDDAAFDECSSVRRITVASGNKVYDSIDNCNAIIETDENRLIRGCMNTIIPNGVSCNPLAFTGFSVERVLRNSGLSEVVKTDVATSSEDTTLLGVAGTYMIDNALARINEIRLEACQNGEPDPNDPTRALTEADYVPIKWSSDLEFIARIRAAESAFTIAHKRTNGSEWSEISGPNDNQKSEEELMALTKASEVLQGIGVWYDEREDWINQNPDKDAGHYKQMIDPTNLYVGIGTFASARTYYENNVVGEFSKESGLDETPSTVSGDCIQKLEVSNDVISNPVICGFLEGATGDTENLSVAVDVEYDVEYSSEDDPDYRWTVEGLIVLDDITWTSSDESVATIDENGKVLAKAIGETTITADLGNGLVATTKYVVKESIGQAEITGIEDKTYTGEEVTQDLTVTLDNVDLEAGADYTVEYSDNLNCGTATLIINGIGKYIGNQTVTFLIKEKPIDQAKITGIEDKTYTGKEITQDLMITLDDVELKVDADYTLEYFDNKNIGTATITITGKGNYTGEQVVTFLIKGKPGWQKIDDYWYFFDKDGAMVTSTWKQDSKGWCWLQEDGKMLTNGWAQDSKGWCWIASNGYMPTTTQWIKYDGGWYHITKGYRDENKWMKDSKGWCWLQEGGRMLTNGWAQDSKGWCWIASNGYMPTTTQWVQYDGGWYHITKGYRDANKWMKDSKGWCWLQADGRMLTNGWAKDSKGWCWIASNGYMPVATQWVEYDGDWYHITKGYRDQNKWLQKDSKWCYVGADGTMVTSTWKKDSKGWCYLDADGFMVTNGWAKDSKGWCWIGANGYMEIETKWVQDYTYYIKNGYRVVGEELTIDGETYVFDADGHWEKAVVEESK